MYKEDFSLDNLQWLEYHKTNQPINQPTLISPAMGYEVLQLFFYEDGFGIK